MGLASNHYLKFTFLILIMALVAAEQEEACNTASVCNQVAIYKPVLPVLQQEQRELEFNSKKWTINQQWDEIGLSAVIWEAAIALAEYLESNSQMLREQRVIELGAGTGLVGMVASDLGAKRVEITDMNTLSAEANLQLNSANLQGKDVVFRVLEWGVTDLSIFSKPYDVILAADVIYIEETFPALLQTLNELSSPGTLILVSAKRRYERDDRFFELAKELFRFEVVMKWSRSDNVAVYRFTKI